MAGDPHHSALTRVQPFFSALIAADASGRSWLPALLGAGPHGCRRLGDLLERPGLLETPLSVAGAGGRLGCFDFPVMASPELLRWFIDHPDRLVWPQHRQSAETERLRRMLIYDDPPGSRVPAQQRARELLNRRWPLSPGWWRFEEITRLDCALLTTRLVITIEGTRDEPIAPATEWYPARSRLVASLEAAKRLANGRQWATLLISEVARPEGSREGVARALAVGAPHLDHAGRAELLDAYLGNLTWVQACEAVGLPRSRLPDRTDVVPGRAAGVPLP